MSNQRALAVAWAAGFVDGDGSICFRKYQRDGRDLVRPALYATQAKDAAPLLRLKELFGGSMNRKGRPTIVGNVVFGYTCCDQPALRAIGEMLPHLVVKRQAAEEVLTYFAENDAYACVHGSSYPRCSECHRIARNKIPPWRRKEISKAALCARYAKQSAGSDVTVPVK